MRTGPPRTQPERPSPSIELAAFAPLLIGPVELPGLLRGQAYLDQYNSGALAIRITCVDGKLGNEQFYGLFSIRPAAVVAETLRPWEFLARVRGENAQLSATLAASGLFEHVRGVQLRSNSEQAGGELLPTWRVASEKLPAALRAAACSRFGWPENYERNRRVLPSQLPEIVKLQEPLPDTVLAEAHPRQSDSARLRSNALSCDSKIEKRSG